MAALKDITGQRFGKLVVLKRDGSDKFGKAVWFCKCDCGNTSSTTGDRLRAGITSSCGCAKNRPKHGQSGSRIYRIWSAMIQRCENPKNDQYMNYGARGITVCDEWHDAATFIKWALNAGYADDLEIDRQDNSMGYEPGNCRFVTSSLNKRNMRTTTMVKWKGRTVPLADIADETGIHKNTLRRRIFKLGMTAEEAVAAPRDTWQTRRSYSH